MTLRERFYRDHCRQYGHTKARCFDLHRCTICNGRHPVENCYSAEREPHFGGVDEMGRTLTVWHFGYLISMSVVESAPM